MQKTIDKILKDFIPMTRFMILFIAGMILLGMGLRALAPTRESLGWFYKLGLLDFYDQSPVVVWVLVTILFFWIVKRISQRIWPRDEMAGQLATLAAFDTLIMESGDILERRSLATESGFRQIYLHSTPVKKNEGGSTGLVPMALSAICWNDQSESLHLFYLGSRRHNIAGQYSMKLMLRPTDKQAALRMLASTVVGAIGGEAAGDLEGIEAEIADAVSEKAGEHTAEQLVSKKNWKIAGLQFTLLLETTGGIALCDLTTLSHLTGRYNTHDDIPVSDRHAAQELAQFLTHIGITQIPFGQADALEKQHKDSPRLRADSNLLPGLPGELVRVRKTGRLIKTTAARAQWVRRTATITRATLSTIAAVAGSWMILTLLGGKAPIDSEWAPQLAFGSRFSIRSAVARTPQLPEGAGVFVISTSGSSLNLRREPKAGAPILAKLRNQSVVLACGEASGWKQILANNQTGWVAARFVKQASTPLTPQHIKLLASRCP